MSRSTPTKTRAAAKASSSGSASFKPKARALSPAEQAQAKEAAQRERKRAYEERCTQLDEEAVAIQRERDELVAEIERRVAGYDNSASSAAAATAGLAAVSGVERGLQGLEDKIAGMQAQTKDWQSQVEAVRQRLVDTEQQEKDDIAQHEVSLNLLVGQRQALGEEIAQIRTRAAHFEERSSRLLERVAIAQEALQRGDDEKEQLRQELWERQGERAVLAADQASAARLGAEQRAQATALEAHVSQLGKALNSEDYKLKRDQQRFRAVEIQLGTNAEDERREHVRAIHAIPQRVEQESLEAQHCRKVFEQSQREMAMSKDAVRRLQEAQERLQEQVQHRTHSLWLAEGMCEAARAAHVAAEQEVKRVTEEVRQMEAWVERMGKQNRRMILSQLPLRDACSALAQENLQAEVLQYMEKYPAPLEGKGSPHRRGQLSRTEVEARAARLGLAGLAGS